MKYSGQKKNRSYRKTDDHEERTRFVVIGVLLIAVLLAAAIILSLRRSSIDRALDESAMEAAASISESQSAEAESLADAEAHQAQVFELCSIPGITELVERYFEARLSADSSAIYEIFGRTDTSVDEDYEARLSSQASWIQSFDDITVYTVPGESDDDVLCVVTYEINFRRTDTDAPGIMYFYAVKGDDGSYTLCENLYKDKVDYAREVLSGASALAMIEDTDLRLKEALDTDSTLALLYVSFQNGEIYKENDIVTDADQEVGFMDPADSILVDDDVLAVIAAEAAEAAAEEAAAGEADVYEAAEDETEEQEVQISMDETAEESTSAEETSESESYAVYSIGSGIGPGGGDT